MDINAAQTDVESAIAHINNSLRWVVGAAGATAAVLVASLQLDSPRLGTCSAVLYTIAVTLAISSAFAALFGAARLLCKERLSAASIAQREFAGNRIDGKPPTEDQADPVVTWIQDERGPTLLGSARSVTDLIQQTQREPVSQQAPAFARLQLVESSLHLHRVQQSFAALMQHAVAAAVVFVAAIATLAILPSVSAEPEQSPVTQPIPVEVDVVDQDEADIPSECGTHFTGFAVGGTLDDPHLVLRATGRCGPMELDDSAGLVVLPDVGEPVANDPSGR